MNPVEQVNIKKINITDIIQNENSRVRDMKLQDLMISIKQDGLLQPIGVMPLKSNSYRLVYGARRYHACKKLGWNCIDALILNKTDKEVDFIILNLAENLQRKNISSIEEGRYFLKLTEMGMGPNEIAVRLGLARNRVDKSIKLFNKLPSKWHSSVIFKDNTIKKSQPGKISASLADKIVSFRKSNKLSDEVTEALLQAAKEEKINTTNFNHVAHAINNGMSIKQAIEYSSSIKTACPNISFFEKPMKRLAKKEGKTIDQFLIDKLKAVQGMEDVLV